MTNSPINLQDLRRRIYAKAKAEDPWLYESEASAGSGGVGDCWTQTLGSFRSTTSCTIDRRKRPQRDRSHNPWRRSVQESVVREIRMLRLMWRGLETELWQAGLRRGARKGPQEPPEACHHRASPRPYRDSVRGHVKCLLRLSEQCINASNLDNVSYRNPRSSPSEDRGTTSPRVSGHHAIVASCMVFGRHKRPEKLLEHHVHVARSELEQRS